MLVDYLIPILLLLAAVIIGFLLRGNLSPQLAGGLLLLMLFGGIAANCGDKIEVEATDCVIDLTSIEHKKFKLIGNRLEGFEEMLEKEMGLIKGRKSNQTLSIEVKYELGGIFSEKKEADLLYYEVSKGNIGIFVNGEHCLCERAIVIPELKLYEKDMKAAFEKSNAIIDKKLNEEKCLVKKTIVKCLS